MAASHASGPASLYAALVGRKMADRLNAATKPTNRETMLEIIVVAVALEGNNGELRFPKSLIDRADLVRLDPPAGQARRLEARFDDVTHEYVVTLTKPAVTQPEQQELT